MKKSKFTETPIVFALTPKNAGGFSAQQAVGHETLEAYAASKGKGFNDAHAYANKFFGGLDPPTTPGTYIFDANGTNLTGVRGDWPVVGKPGVSARITTQFVTPILENDFLKKLLQKLEAES